VKSFAGAPATLGSVATALTRTIVWCKDCRYQIEPDMSARASRYGAKIPIRDWAEKLTPPRPQFRRGD
jgi:hypothetical protein